MIVKVDKTIAGQFKNHLRKVRKLSTPQQKTMLFCLLYLMDDEDIGAVYEDLHRMRLEERDFINKSKT